MAKPAERDKSNWVYTELANTRIRSETNDKIESYQSEKEVPRSEALRQLIRTGLEASKQEKEERRETQGTLLTVTTVAGIAWLALWFTTGPTGSAMIGGATIVGVILYALWPELEARL